MIASKNTPINFTINKECSVRKENKSIETLNEMEQTVTIYKSDESVDLLVVKSPNQMELTFNGYLPYSKRLQEEADNLLAKIKASFGRCVLLRDIDPGCIYWSNVLSKYIALYGLRFSEQEIIAFVKLFYELIIIPNLKSSSVEIFGQLFITFLKKKDSVSPKKLKLEWHPLYELCEKVITHQNKMFAIHRYSATTENTLHFVAVSAKVYFPPSATKEILDTLRPKIYPFDEKVMHITFKLFQWFLPVQLLVEYHSIGYELWLQEFMNVWEICHCVGHWEGNLMIILANLAKYNIGYIDWNPYMPIMFTRFLRSLKLPVDYKTPMSSSTSLQMKYIAEWTISVLDFPSAQKYFEKFIRTIASYFQPANSGRWTKSLEELFNKLMQSFISRLSRERSKKKSWQLQVPDRYKLTETDIDFFVNCMLPVAMISVVDEEIIRKNGMILQYLAMMRPKLVISQVMDKLGLSLNTPKPRPKILSSQVMEKLGFSLKTPIESYKFGAVMDSIFLIRKPFILGSRYPTKENVYPDGPFFVIPLLFSALDGLDANDPTRCYKSIKFITGIAQLVPIIDCSRSKLDKSQEELQLCEDTIRFKKFVLEFMDKIFDLLVSRELEFSVLEAGGEHYGTTPEVITEKIIEEVFNSLLIQSDEIIFNAALKRLSLFIMENNSILTVTGNRLVAVMCAAFRRNNSKVTLRTFLPYFSGKIQNAIGNTKKVLEANNLDVNLIFSLELCKYLVKNARGDHLLPYIITLTYMLKKATLLKNSQGNELACAILGNVLASLTTVQPIRLDQNLDNAKYPYWNDWGKSVDVEEAKIKWYQPSVNAINEAEKFFQYFFVNATKSIQEHANGKNSLSRNVLQRNLRIVNVTLEGLDDVLPVWSEPPIIIKGCGNCTFNFKPISGKEREIKMPTGRNVRNFLVNLMAALQMTMLKNDEDDEKSFLILMQIWENLSLNKSHFCAEVNAKLSAVKYMRRSMENRITDDESYVPQLFLDRIGAQHDLRKVHAVYAFSPTCKYIIQNLYILCTNKYTLVRDKAQFLLWSIFNDYPKTYQLVIPNILETLRLDPIKNHEAHKGALYLINSSPKNSFLTKNDWQTLLNVLPALVSLVPRDQSSVIKELKYIALVLKGHCHSVKFDLNLTESCLTAASELWNISGSPSTVPQPSENEIKKSISAHVSLNESNLYAYSEIFERLMSAVEEIDLNWRHRLLAMEFMSALMHVDHPLPTLMVSYFLQALVNDSLEQRTLGWMVTMQTLRQHRIVYKKRKIKISRNDQVVRPGRRDDNEWMQYNPKRLPKSVEQWEEPRYVHNHWVGYYDWPKDGVEIFAPTLLQPRIELKFRKLTEQEAEIDRFFKNPENAGKFIEYMAVEEKGSQFNFCHFFLLKSLFKHFGDSYLPYMLPQLKSFAASKQESEQRCLIEVVCALICGSRNWNFPMSNNTWKKILPLIDEALENIVEETVEDWKTCFHLAHANRDPARIHWLLEFFIEDTQKVVTNGLVECAKLTFLRSVIRNSVWRLNDILKRLIPIIEERFLDDPTENVRESLAAVLVTIFNQSLIFVDKSDEDDNAEKGKRLSDLIVLCQTVMVTFFKKSFDSVNESEDKPNPKPKPLDILSIEGFVERMLFRLEPPPREDAESECEDCEESEDPAKIIISVCAFIKKSYESSHVSVLPCFYFFYPIIIRLGKVDAEDKVSEICCEALSALARFWTPPKYAAVVLDTIDSVNGSDSCRTLVNNMQFLQVWLFHNMSIVLSDERLIGMVRGIIIHSLEHYRVEIREQAAEMLTGMLYCSILPDESDLMEELIEIGKTNLPRKGIDPADLEYNNAIRLRHASVLGMCAFVRAHPYDIPDSIPPIFEHLMNHIRDPAPIPATIQNTFNDFKRTHCDSWSGLEGLANSMSEEHFELLQDLAVPPSYIT